MNNIIDTIISYIKDVSKDVKLYIITFYNKIYFLINNNFELNRLYKPIIDEKVTINKKLHENVKAIDHKNADLEKNILKLENENNLLQIKISIIEDIITKRHD
ncbi:MAG: hypothetical protein ACREVX_13995 [Clostridium sp.]|uniref:hypothetical protein n=1 Tax=Clostridium sp. TaxID=1506 RepID=UPI003D6D89B6